MIPVPAHIFRITYIRNLDTVLNRDGLHAPNHFPEDGLAYKSIHNWEIQARRKETSVSCGPGGTIHDYVAFYFGILSPMLFQLKTGRVPDYDEGQEPIIYLVSTCQEVARKGLRFVFTDGHGIAFNTEFFDNLENLDRVDWNMVHARYWSEKNNIDIDRQRRKQAEFLVHEFCPWDAIQEIGVINQERKEEVETILTRYPRRHQPVVRVRPRWYY